MYDERIIVHTKKDNDVNFIKLSSVYDRNCSEKDYAEINDEILKFMIDDERNTSSVENYWRKKTTSLVEDNNSPTSLTINEMPTDEKYFIEKNDEEINKILGILSVLTKRQRRRLYMRFKYEMTYKQIGKHEGVALTSVQESCERALENLKPFGNILQNTVLNNWVDLL